MFRRLSSLIGIVLILTLLPWGCLPTDRTTWSDVREVCWGVTDAQTRVMVASIRDLKEMGLTHQEALEAVTLVSLTGEHDPEVILCLRALVSYVYGR